MGNKKIKKLVLNKETLKILTKPELMKVVGGLDKVDDPTLPGISTVCPTKGALCLVIMCNVMTGNITD